MTVSLQRHFLALLSVARDDGWFEEYYTRNKLGSLRKVNLLFSRGKREFVRIFLCFIY